MIIEETTTARFNKIGKPTEIIYRKWSDSTFDNVSGDEYNFDEEEREFSARRAEERERKTRCDECDGGCGCDGECTCECGSSFDYDDEDEDDVCGDTEETTETAETQNHKATSEYKVIPVVMWSKEFTGEDIVKALFTTISVASAVVGIKNIIKAKRGVV